MALTVREQILQYLLNSLKTLSGVQVFRDRDSEIGEDELPAVVLIDGPHTASQDDYGFTRYEMPVGLELYVATKQDSELGTALNALYQQVMALILVDETLGGLAVTTREDSLSDPDINRSEGLTPLAGALLTLNITFMTKVADITSVGP